MVQQQYCLSKLIYDCINSFWFRTIISWNLSESFPYFPHSITHEHLFQCVILTWHFNARSNLPEWMTNIVAGAWDYRQWAHNTTHFMTAVQKIYSVIVEGNCDVYMLLVCWLHHKSESVQCEMTQVASFKWPKNFQAVLRWRPVHVTTHQTAWKQYTSNTA